MEEKNIEITESGIQCDSCDWTDVTVKFADFDHWLNKPCPKCGANLLTEEDYLNAKKTMAMVDYVNSLSQAEMDEIASSLGINSIEDMKSNPVLGKIEGVQSLKNEGEFVMHVSTHKEIKVDVIKNVE